MCDEVIRSVARLEGDAVVSVAECLGVVEVRVSADDHLGDVVVGRPVDDDVSRTGCDALSVGAPVVGDEVVIGSLGQRAAGVCRFRAVGVEVRRLPRIVGVGAG